MEIRWKYYQMEILPKINLTLTLIVNLPKIWLEIKPNPKSAEPECGHWGFFGFISNFLYTFCSGARILLLMSLYR